MMDPAFTSSSPDIYQQSGFTLLEVLIAIVVFALGLLGLAGLQATSLLNNQIAYYRSIGTQLTTDMADRMRANMDASQNGSNCYVTPPITNPDCQSGSCTPCDMARFDFDTWNTTIAAALPSGAGTITGTLANGFAMTVRWSEKELNGATDPACPTGTPANTRCFVTRFTL